MTMDQSKEIGAMVLVLLAVSVVGYMALCGDEPSKGSMIATVAAGVGYLLRGKVEKQIV